jgi:hypothetical protein
LPICEPSADESIPEARYTSEEGELGRALPSMFRVKRAHSGELDGNQKGSHTSRPENSSSGQDILNERQPVTSSAFKEPAPATKAEKRFSFGKGQLVNFEFKLSDSL